MNTSHTEDHSIPPKGVEVIGDLPPGTPWWDAEEIHFRLSRWYPWFGFWLFFIPTLFIVAGDLLLFTADSVESNLMEVWEFVLAMGLLILALVLRIKFYWNLVSMKSVLEFRKEDLSILRPKALPFFPVKSIATVEFQLGQNTGGVVGGWQSAWLHWKPDVSSKMSKSEKIGGIGMPYGSCSIMAQLLNYRIAKAKGENPPPPEFL